MAMENLPRVYIATRSFPNLPDKPLSSASLEWAKVNMGPYIQ